MVDFTRLLDEVGQEMPIDPIELYEQLPSKAEHYGYLREVQGQILSQWHDRRDERDTVIKVNTGGGKTIDGLVILQSYLNSGIVPALYVAPDRYLRAQVVQEAGNLGIAVTTDPDSPEYLSGEAIGVVTAAKLFSGRSVFSTNRPPGHRVPIGAVVIDDAHTAMSAVRQGLSLTIPDSNEAYRKLLDLFNDDLLVQAPDALLDIRENVGNSYVQVPFWSAKARLEQMRTILREYKPAHEADFSYDAVREVLGLVRVVFTRHAVTFTAPCPPIARIASYVEAQHRVFLTATLADDSVLVSDFGVTEEAARNPIQPRSAGDIGERMILAPEEINPSLEPHAIRAAIAELAQTENVFVIVPSDAAMQLWDEWSPTLASASNLLEVVTLMRKEHVGLVVAANKYDGIDLPQKACRVLVLDGLPQAFSGEERIQALMRTSTAGIDDRQVQRIEQGMGRAVRSNEDHCVVFLLGQRLSQLTVDPRTLSRFSAATQSQLKASRLMAKKMENTPIAAIMVTARQALDRDASWVTWAKQALRGIKPLPARVDAETVATRAAFDEAVRGNLDSAAHTLTSAAEVCDDDKRAGQLLEQAAVYVHGSDPVKAQTLLAQAKAKNIYVLRPREGITYTPLSYAGAQANIIASRLASKYGDSSSMRVGVESMLDSLQFDPARTDEFEEAWQDLGFLLGFNSQRPERELGAGPDNLWAMEAGVFWVIEAKTGATTEFIAKRDAGQLAESMLWFGRHYASSDTATPIMVHLSNKLWKDASAPVGMRVFRARELGQLIADIRAFTVGLVATGWSDAADIHRLLVGHKLTVEELNSRPTSTTGGAP